MFPTQDLYRVVGRWVHHRFSFCFLEELVNQTSMPSASATAEITSTIHIRMVTIDVSMASALSGRIGCLRSCAIACVPEDASCSSISRISK